MINITKFELKKEQFTYYTNSATNPDTIFKGVPNVVFRDKKGVLWVGNSQNGIQIFDEKTGNFKRNFYRNSGGEGSLKNAINDITELKDGKLLAGSYAGIEIYDADKKRFSDIGKNEFPFDRVNLFYREGADSIWVLTESGNFVKCSGKGKAVKAFNFPKLLGIDKEIPLRTVVKDNKGKFWIGTWGYGIIIFDPANEKR